MMRTKLKEKLHSRRGASLTFALLLFLVCAAVGSVVLASATATAGRASGNYEYDQRYFAVTSAAELLRETLDGQSVTFTLTRTTKLRQETTYVRSGEDLVLSTQGAKTDVGPTDYKLLITREDGSPIANLTTGQQATAAPADLLGRLATSLVKGRQVNEDLFYSAAWLAPAPGAAPDLPGEMTLTVGTEETLTVKVEPTIGADGSLTLTISNASGSETYQLALTLAADTRSATSSSETFNSDSETPLADDNGDGVPDGVTHTDIYDRMDVKTATVTWRVTEVGKAA